MYQNVDNAKSVLFNCDVLRLNRQKGVLSIDRNRGNAKNRSISLETYVMRNTLLITLIKRAANTSMMYWLRDVVSEASEECSVQGIAHRGYLACINDFDSYYHANMDLLDYSKGDDLLHQSWPFYTRTNDSCPTQYGDEVISREVERRSNGCKIPQRSKRRHRSRRRGGRGRCGARLCDPAGVYRQRGPCGECGRG